ncbi:MAG TPA: DUF2188 domain-containing protein [Fibrobacteria bacterium]|nr:DUF2188 domain-containing protein [Fibrobacteria bacterium]
MQRIIYSVVHKNDEWYVVKSPDQATEGRFKSKPDAVELGRFLAMREEVGELRIGKLDGSIQSEFLFGKDPHQVEG